MIEPGVCPECGAKRVYYTYSLNQNTVAILRALVKAGGEARLADLNLSYTVRCNAQKAGYWNLIVKGGKPHVWRIASAGREWIAGRVRIPRSVIVYRGKPVKWKGRNVLVGDIVPKKQDPEEFRRQAASQLMGGQV